MRRPARPITTTLAMTILATTAASAATVVLGPTSPAWAVTYSAPLRTAVASLTVADEVRTGYERDRFEHWIDADGDGCDTRREVLITEAVTAPKVGARCALSGGRWYSYYDGQERPGPGGVDPEPPAHDHASGQA